MPNWLFLSIFARNAGRMWHGTKAMQANRYMKSGWWWMVILLCGLPRWASAQSVVPDGNKLVTDSSAVATVSEVGASVSDSLSVRLQLPAPRPLFSLAAPGFDGCSPWFMGSYGSAWDLHEGFNAQLSLSVAAGIGKYAPSGVGFGQSGAFAYAAPLSKRFSFAGGAYVQHFDWGPYRHTDVGVAAVLGFRVNDVVSLYAYGAKSLNPYRYDALGCCLPYYMQDYRDRIGAMAEFRVSEKASIQISVERATLPSSPFGVRPMSAEPRNRGVVGQ